MPATIRCWLRGTCKRLWVPVAYYVFNRQLGEKYLSSTADRADRDTIKGWLARSFLKASGIWGSGLDVMLTALRAEIRDHGKTGFPLQQIEREMARRGRSLVFSDEEIEELLEISYGEKRVLPLLTLLYPFIDTRHHIHVDHIYVDAQNSFGATVRSAFDARTAGGRTSGQTVIFAEVR